MKIEFLVTVKNFKARTRTKIFGVPQDEKIIQPGRYFFLSSPKNFSTSQKSRMKTFDFRPSLKADEMAH